MALQFVVPSLPCPYCTEPIPITSHAAIGPRESLLATACPSCGHHVVTTRQRWIREFGPSRTAPALQRRPR